MKKKIDIEVNPKVLDVEIERHTSWTRLIPWPKGDKWEIWEKWDKWDKGDRWEQWPRWFNGLDWIDWQDGKDWKDGKNWTNGKDWKQWPRWLKWPKGDDWKPLKFSDLTPYQIQTLTWSPWNPWEWVPRWGTTWQILAKRSWKNFDTEWINWWSGTGAVDSVNGQTGVVVLDADDISDTSTTNKFTTTTEKNTWNAKQNALTADVDYLTPWTAWTTYEPKKWTDDNYVTDAEKIVIGNTSGTNTGDNATNSQYSGLASSKQDTLISGTNIKTINSTSLLGSWDIVISGGTDEKVKYDAWDPTAWYVADKIIAWTGISVAEWTGANENKLVVTSTITQATRDSLWLDTDDTVTFANLSWTNTWDQTLPTRGSLWLDTDDSPQFAWVNVWHASDTTITRVSAWVIAVEWVNVSMAWHTHEWTAILSTGEAGGNKFLREDWDGTCSWQAVWWGWAWALRSYSTATSDSITVSSLNLTTDNNHYRIIVDMSFSTASDRAQLYAQINGVTTADSYWSVYTWRTFDWSAWTAATSDGSYKWDQWKFNWVWWEWAHAVIDLHTTKDASWNVRIIWTYKMSPTFLDSGQDDFWHYEWAILQNSETNVTAIKFFNAWWSQNKAWRVWVLYPAVA